MVATVTSADEARTVAERYAEAWSSDDLEGILGCYDDRFTLHYFGDNPFTGSHVGRDAALAVLLEVGSRAPRKLVAVDEILAGPGAAVIVARERITTGDHRAGTTESTEIRRVLRYRVEGDRFTECWLYEESQAVIDRAWSDPET